MTSAAPRSLPDIGRRAAVAVLGGFFLVAVVFARPMAGDILFALLAILGYRELVGLRWAVVTAAPKRRGLSAAMGAGLPIAVGLGVVALGCAVNLNGFLLVVTIICLMMLASPTLLAWVYPTQLGAGFLAAALLRERFPDDPWVLMTVLGVTWSCDIGAYLVGCRWGHTPLAPTISPKKSWEGAVGGMVAAILLGALIGGWRDHATLGVAFGAVAGTAGQIGDLVQSRYKRRAGAKDSGALFPGHGGVLDRFDSLLVNAPLCYLLAERFW